MSKTNTLDTSPLSSGKYKGKTPEEVADISPKYLAERPHLCSRALLLACESAIEDEQEAAAEEAEYSRGYN
jgi:hypothetical protein